jgi:uncharacterized protein (TIGR02271 family)
MTEYKKFHVVGEGGLRGTVYATSRFFDESEFKLMRLEDGREFLVPSSALASRPDGSYQLQIPVSELDRYGKAVSQRADDGVRSGTKAIPAIEERLDVHKQPVETGRVRVHKHVGTTEATVDEPLFRDTFDIKHVPVNRIVDHPPEIRHDGDTTILPVLEEVLVVEKRLILREELHIVRKREEYRDPRNVPLRKEEIEVERVDNKTRKQ